MKFVQLFAIAAILAPSQGLAQMAVTTFGATDAELCFKAALDNFSTDTTDCDEALKRDGMTARDRTATFVNRGVLLNRAGRLEEALKDFDTALAADSDAAEAYLNRGNSYFMMRRYDEALADYRMSLDKGLSKSHIAWYNIGLVYEFKKDELKAKEAYRTALEIAPGFGPAQKKLGRPEMDGPPDRID